MTLARPADFGSIEETSVLNDLTDQGFFIEFNGFFLPTTRGKALAAYQEIEEGKLPEKQVLQKYGFRSKTQIMKLIAGEVEQKRKK